MYLWTQITHRHTFTLLFGPVSFHMPSGLGPGRRRHWPSRRLRRRHLRPGRRRHLRSRRLLAPHSSRRSALEHAAAGSSACKTRSQPVARPSCLSVSARPCVQYAARVHAKLAMAKCHDGSLEIWPVTGSTVTWHELSGEEALRIGNGARSTNGIARGKAAVPEGKARTPRPRPPRSPRLIFHLSVTISL